MKKFWKWLAIALIVVVAFLVVSCVMSSINDVSVLALWQSWWDSICGIKETTETAMISFVR